TLAGLRQRYAARGAIDQADTEAFFKPGDGVAERRWRDAEFGRRGAKAAMRRNRGHRVQFEQSGFEHYAISCITSSHFILIVASINDAYFKSDIIQRRSLVGTRFGDLRFWKGTCHGKDISYHRRFLRLRSGARRGGTA